MIPIRSEVIKIASMKQDFIWIDDQGNIFTGIMQGPKIHFN
mgnify:CR=1 FL=1